MNKFPYNMQSREALVELIRSTQNMDIQDDLVTFEDIIYSPTDVDPGRTYIEMIDLRYSYKYWYAYRRLELDKVIPVDYSITLAQRPTPAAIANEINRSLDMKFDSSDVSFSNTILTESTDPFIYRFQAFAGSYAYCGYTDILVNQAISQNDVRLTQLGDIRITETGIVRRTE